ncbi:MAG: polymer-forming cytoskeletal protein [Gammaproteobacteria bacterium]|nr:polymer-forming cytoskeletal protein [Gammaproteobacteria bacterium]
MFGKSMKPESGITLVANNCELTGDVHFSDQLLVNGVVKGNVYAREGSKATVTVSEKGRVKGEIRAPKIIVNGKVFGDIYSDKHVELAARAEVRGNVYYNLIEMVMGSRVEGSLVHVPQGKEAGAASKASEAPAADVGPEKRKETETDSAGSDTRPVTAMTGKS